MEKVARKDISDASHKIALLAVFITAVLCSFLVVTIKSNINIGKPIPLIHSGFEVSLPAGEQWEIKTQQWEFSQEFNYFYTGAIQKQEGFTTTVAQWRYIVCPEQGNATETLEKRGKDFGAVAQDNQTYIGNGFGAHTAYYRTDHNENIYLALVVLEPGRAAELEVRSKQRFPASDIFFTMLKAAKFEPNGLLTQGREVIDSIPASVAINGTSEPFERVYLLESNGMFDGFSAIRSQIGKAQQTVKSVTYANIGMYEIYRRSFFTRDITGRIKWEFSQDSSQTSVESRMLIEYVPGGKLTIKNLKAKQQKTLNINSFFCPEILDFELFQALVSSGVDECVIDILMPQGQVMPVYIKKIENNDGRWQLSLIYLHAPELDLKVDIGNNRLIRSRILDTDTQHRLYLCEKEDIIARYPRQSSLLQELTK